MKNNYDCNINININIKLDGGDIQFDVSNDEYVFSFKSGLAFMAIPHFLSTLASFYTGSRNEVRIDCHGNFDYFIFSSDGINIWIEHFSHYPTESRLKYQFVLREYMEAIDQGFNYYLQQLEAEGILPLQSHDLFHPIGNDVLHAYHHFSALVRGEKN